MKDVVIIGGGFYGLYIAEFLALHGHRVKLFDEQDDYMLRSSFNNQARVHNGYHYPRSTLTALRSRVSYPKFLEEFEEAIYDKFTKYYMVGQPLGKVSPYQFEQFCNRIDAPFKRANDDIWSLVNKRYISGIYETEEVAFDALKLKSIMLSRVISAGVQLYRRAGVYSVSSLGGKLAVHVDASGDEMELSADQVFNCTYSNINIINRNSNLDVIPLRHELTEMCLVELPEKIKDLSFTVMCGPFFSIMPFPSTCYSSFSHVRYTPHFDWKDDKDIPSIISNDILKMKHKSKWRSVAQDAKRYMPILEECVYKKSLWETKTILPISDVDDSRPILFKKDYGIEGYHCIMGGKIDNIYDVINVIKKNKIHI